MSYIKKIILVLLCWVAVSQAFARTITTEELLAPHDFTDSAVQIDAEGTIHVIYGDDALYYAEIVDDVVTTTVIDPSGSFGDPGERAFLMDDSGFLHVFYVINSVLANGIIYYATNLTGTWVTEEVIDVGGGNNAIGLSAVLDSAAKLHVIYYEENGAEALRYINNTSGSWSAPETIDEATSATNNLHYSLGIDSQDILHITYYSTDQDLLYLSGTSENWASAITLDSTGNVGSYNSLVVDSNDQLHVVYYDATNGDLKYINTVTDVWQSAITLDSTGDAGQYAAMAIDQDDHLFVSYYDATMGNLRYIDNTTGSWTVAVVDETDDVGQYSSIAVNATGDLVITYYDETNGTIEWTTGSLVSFATSQTVDAMLDYVSVGYWPSLVLDAEGALHVLHNNSLGMMYSTNASGDWEHEQILETSNGIDYISADMDSLGDLHVVYQDAINRNLDYLSNTGGSWSSPELLDETGDVGAYSFLRIDSEDVLHVIYMDSDDDLLRYLVNTGSGFETPSGFLGFDDGDVNAFTFDENNAVHLVYFDYINTALKYTVDSGDGFSTPVTIDTFDDPYEKIAIALDEAGFAYVAYYDTDNNELNYATNASGNWVVELVDTINRTSSAMLDFVLDANGFAHIVYYDTRQILKYATNRSGSWEIETLDEEANYSVAMAINEAGLHVMYQTVSRDLKYALIVYCGDGVLDTGEECDDTNLVDGDGCSSVCEDECGNGTLDTGETCDDGESNSDTTADACRTTCVAASCGDGVIDTGEECDDGNTEDGDDCSAVCANETSGDDDDNPSSGGGGGCQINTRSGVLDGSVVLGSMLATLCVLFVIKRRRLHP